MKEPTKKKITLKGLKNALKLYSFIKPYKIEFLIGLILLIASSLTNLAFPYLLGKLVNAGDNESLILNINKIALILLVLLTAQSIFSYFRIILFVNVTEKTLAYLRTYTYNHIIKLPLTFFDKKRVGELNSRISSDISLLQETLTTTIADLIRQLIIIIGGITLLAITSAKLTLFMLSILPAVVFVTFIFGRFIRRYSKKSQKKVAESNTIVEETLQGIRSVKAYTNEFFEIKRYKNKTDEIARIGMKGGKYRGALVSFIILGLFGTLTAIIWKGSILLAQGEMNSGELVSFIFYSVFIAGSMGGFANVIAQIQKFLGATEDLFDIYNTEQEQVNEVQKSDFKNVLNGNILFENLTFSYPSREDDEVLKNINFSIDADQIVALVGASGAGKSTITSLILRMHEPTAGKILFDKTESKDISISELRNQIALVPQDIFLFGGTIKENIAYGKPDASDDEIKDAAEKANALEFINRFPDAFETIVGERGTQLSGGQRQRIAIARAVLNDPRILILDEATSALDSESEKLVQDALEKLMIGRTSIVIAHRLSTIRKADQIFVIDKGMIVERGTHEELIKLEDGIYKKQSELQGYSI